MRHLFSTLSPVTILNVPTDPIVANSSNRSASGAPLDVNDKGYKGTKLLDPFGRHAKRGRSRSRSAPFRIYVVNWSTRSLSCIYVLLIPFAKLFRWFEHDVFWLPYRKNNNKEQRKYNKQQQLPRHMLFRSLGLDH